MLRHVDPFLVVLAMLAGSSGIACYLIAGDTAVLRAFAATGSMLLLVAPQLVAGLLVGALVQQLIDRDTVVRLMGSGRSLKHLLAAEGAGALTPGGAFAFFPTIHALRSAGADVAILITYLTAWALFGFTRILVFELPLLGTDLTLFRLVANLPLPLIAGILAGYLLSRGGFGKAAA